MHSTEIRIGVGRYCKAPGQRPVDSATAGSGSIVPRTPRRFQRSTTIRIATPTINWPTNGAGRNPSGDRLRPISIKRPDTAINAPSPDANRCTMPRCNSLTEVAYRAGERHILWGVALIPISGASRVGERHKPWEATRPTDIDHPWAFAFRWLRRPEHTKPPTVCDALCVLGSEVQRCSGWR